MWQTFCLWGQVTWRKSLRIAVTRRKPSNCFVFAAGRILSSHLLSSVNFCGRLKTNTHSSIDHLVCCSFTWGIHCVWPAFRLRIPTLTSCGPIWTCFCKSCWLRTPGRPTGGCPCILNKNFRTNSKFSSWLYFIFTLFSQCPNCMLNIVTFFFRFFFSKLRNTSIGFW